LRNETPRSALRDFDLTVLAEVEVKGKKTFGWAATQASFFFVNTVVV